MNIYLKKGLVIGSFIGITLTANQASADAISVFSVGNPNGAENSELINIAEADKRSRTRRPLAESYHGSHAEKSSARKSRGRSNSSFGHVANSFSAPNNNKYRNNRSSDYRSNQFRSSDSRFYGQRASGYRSSDSRRGDRQEYRSFSYTSPPLRGGSSRRTRIIENPYADRLVTGITLTGVDNRQVHIKDVVAYPGRYLLSPLAYSLSQYDRPRFINTQNYIDYVSVAAKRKEYFTVTFHYD